MNAVVIGRNYTSRLGMIRAAGMAGCDVVDIATVRRIPSGLKDRIMGNTKPVDSHSKYVKRLLFSIEPDREALIDLLLKECMAGGEKVILLPVDDFAASTIDLFQERLEPHFLYPHIEHKPGEIFRLMDKGVQKQLAREAGLPVANGWAIEIHDGRYRIPTDITYPCFPKPEISVQGDKQIMKKCSTEAELRGVLDAVAAATDDCPVLVEEYIELQKEYGILGFCDQGKVTIPGIVEKKRIGNGKHKGVTMTGLYSPLEAFGSLGEKLSGFMSKVSLTGLFDIDLYEKDGVIFFNELNLRLGAFGYAAVCAGFNLPGCFISAITGSGAEQLASAPFEPILCISEKVALDDYQGRYMTWPEYRRTLLASDQRFIFCADDPEPYRFFRRTERLEHVKRVVRSTLKRYTQ